LLAAVLMLSSEERDVYILPAGAGHVCEVTVNATWVSSWWPGPPPSSCL